MDLIDFYLIFMSDVDVADLMDLPVVYTLFGDDPRFETRCFLEGHLQILW